MRQLELRLMEFVQRGRTPGLQYMAVDATATLMSFAAGFAELRNRPMSIDTALMAYSMSKTITAVAVLQLIEHGRLGIDDAIAMHLSWQPYGERVTVRQLLSHTGGLPNPIPLRWIHPPGEFDESAALRSVLRDHARLATTPGTRFAYSNIGYWLLGALIEELSGVSFASYVQSEVFAPLGLTSRDMAYAISDRAEQASGYLERFSAINLMRPFLLDRRFTGEGAGRWLEIRPHRVNGPAFGGIVGSARGFATFLQDQLRGRSRVLGGRARALLYEPQRTPKGEIPMTLGWHIGSLAAQRCYFKEGGGAGFHSMMRLYQAKGIATVLMTNATTFNVSKALDTVDALLLPA